MQFNKNKIIFFAMVGVLLIGLIFFLLVVNSNSNKSKRTTNTGNNSEVSIWMFSENPVNMLELVQDFQKTFPKYEKKKIQIETFTNYEEYYYALSSAFAKGLGPDIFTLNNNEKSVFIDNVVAVSPNKIKPIDFRKSFKPVFAGDLIKSLDNGTEFVTGIPVGYETLGVFYNKKYVRSTDLESLSQMNAKINKLKSQNKSILPIAIGNGSTVDYAPDIVTQLVLLSDTAPQEVQKLSTQADTLAEYMNYGIEGEGNGFNGYYSELKTNGKTSAYMLANNMSAMAIGYPRFLEKIEADLSSKKKRLFKTFLSVEPFPYATPGLGKTFVNYDYFVINKNTANFDLSQDFLLYLATEKGSNLYLSLDTYKLPALVAGEKYLETKKIHKDYNIVLSNFLHENIELSSFDKGIKNIYDKEMVKILDMGQNFKKSFSQFTSSISCMSDKVQNLSFLSEDCRK